MNPTRGGVQKVTDILAKYFIRTGHRVYYLTYEFDEKDKYKFPATLYHLPDNDFFSKSNLKYYHNLLSGLLIDIIINHDASNDRSRFFLNTGTHTAKKISLYHQDPLYGIIRLNTQSGILRKFLFIAFPGLVRKIKIIKKRRAIKFLLKNSDSLILLSNEFKRLIATELKTKSCKISVINNPCVYYKTKELCDKKKKILFVSRMILDEKNPDKMLYIWSRLQGKFPDWELIFLGDGPDRIQVEELAKTLNLWNVYFEGYVDPLPYYKEASIICMTSNSEGFGLTLVEGMSFGVVPITFNNWAALKDIIIDGETGILVESDNLDDYTKKLQNLLINEEHRQRISLNASRFAGKFDIELIGPLWLELFQTV